MFNFDLTRKSAIPGSSLPSPCDSTPGTEMFSTLCAPTPPPSASLLSGEARNERINLRVLLVEDDPREAAAIEALCPGHRITVAATRVQYLEALAHGTFDVALIDYNVPGLPWKEAMAMCRWHAPTLPVVVISGFGQDSTIFDALMEGADDFIQKNKLSQQLLEHVLRREVALAEMRTRAREAAARVGDTAGV